MSGERVGEELRDRERQGCCPGQGMALGTGMEKWEESSGKGKVV